MPAPPAPLRRYAPWRLFLAAAYFPVFLHLDSPPVRTWDESLFAMRAYYTAGTGAYLPNFEHFPGITYYRNLKPPFGTWLQAASFRLFGVSELALRLPVSAFVLATVLLQFFWLKKQTGRRWPGWAAGLILLTSAGYLTPHVARTGDHDAILAFLLLLQLWAGYRLLRAAPPLPRGPLWLLAATLLAGFLTKSVVAFFFLPGLLVFALYKRNLGPLLRQPPLYLAAAAVLAGIAGYYLWMETRYPGFLAAVRETVLGRYVAERNQMGQPFWYYFRELAAVRFLPWIVLLPLNYLLRRRLTPAQRDLSVLLWSAVLGYLLIISFSETKLAWYDASVYPPLALLAGLALYQFDHWVADRRPRFRSWAAGGLFLLLFAPAYAFTVHRCATARLEGAEEQYAYLMRKLAREFPDLTTYTVYCGPFNGQVAFYTRWYNDRKGYDIRVATNFAEGDFRPGDRVLVCREEKKAALRERFELAAVTGYYGCQLYWLN